MQIALREPTDADLRRIYAAEGEHVVAVVGGEPAAWIAVREIDGRTWGMFGILEACTADTWRRLFYAFRKHLMAQRHAVFVLARNQAAERLLRILGFVPTHEIYAEKRVWIWIPHK